MPRLTRTEAEALARADRYAPVRVEYLVAPGGVSLRRRLFPRHLLEVLEARERRELPLPTRYPEGWLRPRSRNGLRDGEPPLRLWA